MPGLRSPDLTFCILNFAPLHFKMLNYATLYILPLLSAITAWLLCLLGLKIMMRRLYNQRTAIANKVAQSFSGDLLNAASIKQKITDPAKLTAVKPMIEAHVTTFLNIKLQEKLPVIAMFASADMLEKIKEGLMEEIDLLLPEVIEQYVATLVPEMDTSAIISKKAEAISEEQLKNIFGENTVTIQWFAALFGLITGSIPLLFFVL
jgi:uncharacterized membrane protein YheB (UPF0754 family)